MSNNAPSQSVTSGNGLTFETDEHGYVRQQDIAAFQHHAHAWTTPLSFASLSNVPRPHPNTLSSNVQVIQDTMNGIQMEIRHLSRSSISSTKPADSSLLHSSPIHYHLPRNSTSLWTTIPTFHDRHRLEMLRTIQLAFITQALQAQDNPRKTVSSVAYCSLRCRSLPLQRIQSS